jgi:S-(hydroxymethyl)mycothiol dehydrogenase
VTRGLVYAEAGARPAVEEITLDAPGANEVQVRVEACGVCHTDLHVVETNGWGMRFPILLGHEGAGVVEEVGGAVESVAPGDRVVIAWRAPCGDSCRSCKRGDPRRCSNNLRAKRRLRRATDGETLNAVLRCGTFADRVIVHERCAVRMPEALPAEQACLIACGFSTGAGAALWATPVQEGSSVAVIGCGGVGLAAIQGARLAGAARIVAVDVLPEKLALAAELGATDTVDASSGDAVAQVRELTDGVDYSFSAITPASGLVDAVRMCAYGGTATLVGVPPPRRALEVDVERDLFHPKVAIAVTHGGDTIPQEDFPFLAEAVLDGRLDLDRFVTKTISLDEAADALDELRDAPAGIRTVVLL